MEPTRQLTTFGYHGTDFGTPFDDSTHPTTASISRIIASQDVFVRSLAVYYADGTTPGVRGSPLLDRAIEFNLEPGEFIVRIEGGATNHAVSRLAFVTNTGRARTVGPIGQNLNDVSFVWDPAERVPPEFAAGMRLLYFSGLVQDCFYHLSATFGSFPSPHKYIKYEHQIPIATSPSPPLNSFGQTLTSPPATLTVGASLSGTVFHTTRALLERVPSFRILLAQDQTDTMGSVRNIDLPDETPRVVTALLEFLYTGAYTYTYPPGLQTVEGEREDGEGKDEAAFHAAVFVVARKYGCAELENVAGGWRG